ncbi:tetratricopeptide repeat protein [Kaarinaea lacus]
MEGFSKFIRLSLCNVYAGMSVLILVAGGCGSTGGSDQTLEALESRVIVVEQQSLPQATPEDARKSYKEVLETTNNQQLKARALERLTDLQLENQQSQAERAIEQKIEAFEPQTSVTRKPSAQEQQTAKPTPQAQPPKTQPETQPPAQPSAPPIAAASAIPAPIPSGAGAVAQQSTDDLDFDTAGDYMQVAKQYEALLKRYPGSKDNERILYQLARAYDLAGEMEKALVVLTQLVKEYPDSKKVEEAQFRRGEILFSQKSYSKAVAAYRVVLNNRKSEFYERALYKHGWSLFKSNNFDTALKSFYDLLDYHFESKKDYEDFSRSEKELLDDTFRVISLTHSYGAGARSIAEFSKTHGQRPYEHLIYEQLAQLYLGQERNEDAAKTYLAYVDRYPNSKQSPELYIKVINIYTKGGFPTLLTEAKAEFVNRYGVGKSYWDSQSPELLAQLTPQLKSNLKDLAAHYHAIGQKSKKPQDYQTAAYWYTEYVRSFPKEADSANMNFLLAEVLLESGNYTAAATEYENTAYNYPPHEKSAEAGYAAILAHQRQMSALKGEQLLDKRREAITSSLNFADNFPDDPRVPPVLLKVSEEFVDLEQYKDASTVARRLTLLQDPKLAKMQIDAWAIVANAEFELGNYKEAEEATIQRLKATDPNNDPERTAHIERLAAAIYKQGEAEKEEGNIEAAADHFLRISTLAPTSTIRVTAEYDAAVVLAQAQLWDKAIPVLNRFIQLYPNHKFSKNAVETLALGYENTGKLTNAAATYVEIYNRETDPEKKRALVWQTAELYEKAEKKKSAIDVYQQYVQLYPQPVEQAVEARIRIADYYQEQKQINLRHQWLNEIIKADAAGPSTERTQFLAAKASLELAEPVFQEYEQVKLVLPLKPNLKKKKELMEQSIEVYTKAANYGVAEVTTASTYRIAEIYRDFSKKLFNSERPKGLSPEELEQYDLLLEEQAYPFEEKSIDIHETNANRAYEGIYDEWVQKSFGALQKLQPIRYAKNERSELFSQVIN